MARFWPFRRQSTATETHESDEFTRRLHGREYTFGVPYALPSDLSEMNRLDFQHLVLRQAFKGNYAAPIDKPRSILDVGTGTARWAKEMALVFPQANVVGLDVKEPLTDEQNVPANAADARPANYSFVLGNVLEGLPFPDESFDFVHQRLLFFAIPADRWQFALSELVRVTRRGGWIEIAEGHFGYVPSGPATTTLVDAALAALLQRGIDPRSGPVLQDYLTRAGLTDVRHVKVDLPVGVWGGRVGTLVATDLTEAHNGSKPLVLTQGISDAEWTALRDAMRQEWEQLHSAWPFYIAYGRRP